ncbi:unnamed protein product [Arctia plantaginis]|uniref:Uncharacterized protein n=1 Tax=Arctia plantaginis TaxID=874455 RepID=A0A8S1A2E3_ARCPL|nr:unnamed protein product [Arctia plantaginis]
MLVKRILRYLKGTIDKALVYRHTVESPNNLPVERLGHLTKTCTLDLDNESAIKLSHNPKYEYHRRTKHIKFEDGKKRKKHLFMREYANNSELEVKQVPSVRQLADMLTNPLFGPRLEELSEKIGLKRI